MAVYSLDLNLRHDAPEPITAVLAALPARTASALWAPGYEVGTVGPSDPRMDGFTGYVGHAMVRFNDGVSREAALDTITGLSGVLDGFTIGTTISLHTCFHDETPPRGCEVEVRYEVVA